MPKKLTRCKRKARDYPGWKIKEKSGGRTVYAKITTGNVVMDFSKVIVQIRGKRPGKGWHVSDQGNQADLSKMIGPFDSFDAAAACFTLMFTNNTNRSTVIDIETRGTARRAGKSAALGAAYGAGPSILQMLEK